MAPTLNCPRLYWCGVPLSISALDIRPGLCYDLRSTVEHTTTHRQNSERPISIMKIPLSGLGIALLLSAVPATAQETIGGGTVASPAVGPPPSFGIGGPGMVLVKNWHFGTDGTIKNYADMSANFFYHDQFGTIGNGTNYGAVTVAPDAANALARSADRRRRLPARPPVHRRLAEDVPHAPGRRDDGATRSSTTRAAARSWRSGSCPTAARCWAGTSSGRRGCATSRRPTSGSRSGRPATSGSGTATPRARSTTWSRASATTTAARNTNYDGRYWHSNTVASPGKDTVDYGDWGKAMAAHGIKSYDAAPVPYLDLAVQQRQHATRCTWTASRSRAAPTTTGRTAARPTDEPIDMDFLFDGGWGHTQIGSVNKPLPAAAFDGKSYEWNYSRVYLSGDAAPHEAPFHGPHTLPGTVRAADYDTGGRRFPITPRVRPPKATTIGPKMPLPWRSAPTQAAATTSPRRRRIST